jgi:alpha-ketoglutarate-dependent taurine dioxygenase
VRINELAATESRAVLDLLFRHVTTDEFTVRLNWAPDTLVIWDSRATQHKPVNDFFPQHRRMHQYRGRRRTDADQPMDGALGADVFEMDVRHIDAKQLDGIQTAQLEYHVLALRDQQLAPAALSAFAARLGEREVYPFAQSLPDDPYVGADRQGPSESNFGGIWHTDSSYLPEPPSLTLLYAVS